MAFSFNENQIVASGTNYISFVRFQIDDTDSTAYDLSDGIISALYSETSASDTQISRNYQTAIKAADYLYRKYSKLASFSADGVSIQYKDRADMWLNIVNTLVATWNTLTDTSSVIFARRCANFTE